MQAAAAQQPLWHPDPRGTHQERWWGGVTWTNLVRDGGVQGVDPDYGDRIGDRAGGGSEAPTLGQQIRELGELRDQGLLTEEEFAAQKVRLLGG